MRILQIIDSLEAGGAERMAVNYANALAGTIEFSGLVATRKEGALLHQLHEKVNYLFLNKKRILDLKALFHLRQFVKQNKIGIVHAHSTSIFLAFLLKLSRPSIQLVWHDHYGDSEFLSKRPSLGLKIMSSFINGIVSVNQKLKLWAKQQLRFENVIYLPNFPSKEKEVSKQTILKGIQGKRILCLANLRAQKNHFLLLEVAKKMKLTHPEWTFHLVGKDFEDNYSVQLKELIVELKLENTVFIYGSKEDVQNILGQATIGILTSQSEGLPVAILEYGLQKKAVVVTNVGEIYLLVQNGLNGLLVETGNVSSFYDSLVKLIENEKLQKSLGNALHQTIKEQYSEKAVIKHYLYWLENNLK